MSQENTPAESLFPVQIRGGYMNIRDISLLEQMYARGMNAALVKFGDIESPISPDQLQLLLKWSIQCKKHHIKFIPVINLWGWNEKKWITPNDYFIYRAKQKNKTPCPLDHNFYTKSIHNRLIELAKISKNLNIAGVVIDLEMYGADIKYFPEPCLCDHCFYKFLQQKKIEDSVPIKKRKSYLLSSALMDEYQKFQENHVKNLAIKTQEEVRKITPNLIIGACHLDRPHFYNRALLKGFGCNKIPVFAFTEMTYSKGYSSFIKQTVEEFRKNGANANLVAGIWQDKFPINTLPAQYYYCAKDCSGYWIYSLHSLLPEAKKEMPYSKQEYWQAIGKANFELYKSATDPNYKPPLKLKD